MCVRFFLLVWFYEHWPNDRDVMAVRGTIILARLCIVLLIAGFVSDSVNGNAKHPLEVSVVGTSDIQVSPGHSLSLQCQINRTPQELAGYKLEWVHAACLRDPAVLEEKVLTQQQEMVYKDINYSVKIDSDSDITTMTLSMKKVRHQDDGLYICRVSSQRLLTNVSAEVQLSVNSDVQQVQLQFDTESPVRGESNATVKRDSGQYRVTCTAGGFNPTAKVRILVNAEEVMLSWSDMTLDVSGSARAQARRWNFAVTGTIDLDVESRLSCQAKADFEGATTKKASIALATSEDFRRHLHDDCCRGDYKNTLPAGIGLSAEPRTIITIKNAFLSLDCGAVGDPNFGNLSYVWKKDGSEIGSKSAQRRRYIHPNGTLHVRRIIHHKNGTEKSDEGLYECYTTNSVGTILAQRIQVLIASLWKEFLAEPAGMLELAVGENVFLPCRIQATPQDLMIVWQKDANVLKPDVRHVLTEQGLLILNAQLADTGLYECQVTNKNFFSFVHDDMRSPLQWRNSQSAAVNVSKDVSTHGGVFFKLKPENITEVLYGRMVDILCVPSLYNVGEVSWTRNDPADSSKQVPVEDSGDVTVLPWGRLRILRVAREHEGTFTCTHGHIGTSVRTSLVVLEEPSIQDSTQSTSYPLASSIRLNCEATGHPVPKVTWLKNGAPIVTVQYRIEFIQAALVIYQGRSEDSGYYQCLAVNKVSWALGLTRISVRIEPDAPSAPFNVTGEVISSTRIMIHWMINEEPDRLLSFSVHLRLARLEGGEEIKVIERELRSIVLADLLPDSTYAISLRAYTARGASPSSSPVFIRTDLPGSPTPSLTYLNNASILIRWSDFHARHRRKDDILNYVVSYGLSNSQQVEKVILDKHQDTHVLTNLEENREYRVHVSAMMSDLDTATHGDAWSWSYVRTDNLTRPMADHHLSAPYNLSAFTLKPDTISLSWSYSNEEIVAALPVTHYTIRSQARVLGSDCQDNVASQSVALKTSHSNVALLQNLLPFTRYNISVSANSDSLQGPFSIPILVQTEEDVPSSPVSLVADVGAAGQVLLQWMRPAFPNGLIQGHYIQYIDKERWKPNMRINGHNFVLNMSSWNQLYQRGNGTRATVSNLTPSDYYFLVRACTNVGPGAPSTVVLVSMEDKSNGSVLSEQHLGIIGGSVIGLTSILITIFIIVYKQRQLQRQLEQQPCCRPEGVEPSALASHFSSIGPKRDELEKLLEPPAVPATSTPAASTVVTVSAADSERRDSGCSSSSQPGDDNETAAEDLDSERLFMMEEGRERAERDTDGSTPWALGGAETLTDRETLC